MVAGRPPPHFEGNVGSCQTDPVLDRLPFDSNCPLAAPVGRTERSFNLWIETGRSQPVVEQFQDYVALIAEVGNRVASIFSNRKMFFQCFFQFFVVLVSYTTQTAASAVRGRKLYSSKRRVFNNAGGY